MATTLRIIASSAAVLALQAHAEEAHAPTYSLFGTVGLIDMPTAESAPDAEFAFSTSLIGDQHRNTMTFQITPRLSGSFRYTATKNDGFTDGENYDRSFDLQYRFLDEGNYRPAIAVGLRDALGTGQFSSEYFVATKNVSPRVAVTGGIGWGQLGTHNGFSNPLSFLGDSFDERPEGRNSDTGGQARTDHWFRGDAAFFGGVEWRATDKLSLKAEYSSDAYTGFYGERSGVEHKSPFNFGLGYQLADSVHLAGYYAYGSELALQLSFSLNPKKPARSERL